jgi:spermidine/putrescine transport system permease protein
MTAPAVPLPGRERVEPAPLRRPPLVVRLSRLVLPVYTALAVLYLFLPIIVMIVFSFNNPRGRQNITWQGFTPDNYISVWGRPDITGPMVASLIVAVAATIVATALGTLIGLALTRYQFRARGSMNMLIYVPMATPEIILGASLLTLWVSVGVQRDLMTIIIAHVMFNISFVVVTVRARIAGFNRSLEEAAMDLGANEWATFRKVTFPIIFPGILAAGLLAFALSIDDYVITSFVAGQTTTFPLWVFGASRFGVPPEVNVLGTLIFVVAFVLIFLQILWARRRSSIEASLARQAEP